MIYAKTWFLTDTMPKPWRRLQNVKSDISLFVKSSLRYHGITTYYVCCCAGRYYYVPYEILLLYDAVFRFSWIPIWKLIIVSHDLLRYNNRTYIVYVRSIQARTRRANSLPGPIFLCLDTGHHVVDELTRGWSRTLINLYIYIQLFTLVISHTWPYLCHHLPKHILTHNYYINTTLQFIYLLSSLL